MNITDTEPQGDFAMAQELKKHDGHELSVVQGPHPMEILQEMTRKGVPIDQIREIRSLVEWHEGRESKRAFDAALAEFKKEPIRVTKDKFNKQYESWYTSIGNLVNTVSPILAKYGLSATWRIDQANGIEVTAVLTHSMGHTESVPMSGPADDSGRKNPLQQIKSTVTYLKSATFQAVTGIIADEANADDDGNASGGDVITEAEVKQVGKLIERAGADKEALLKFAKAESLEAIPRSKLGRICERLNDMIGEQ